MRLVLKRKPLSNETQVAPPERGEVRKQVVGATPQIDVGAGQKL